MTREEAIIVLNMVEAHGLADKAKRMAIKALEFDLDKHDEEVIKNTVETLWGEPCEDCVSREAVLDACDQSINIFDATDRIKELPSVKPNAERFAKWVATEIFDDMWEDNKDSFAEIACRKLAKLGIVRANDDKWELVEPQESEEV